MIIEKEENYINIEEIPQKTKIENIYLIKIWDSGYVLNCYIVYGENSYDVIDKTFEKFKNKNFIFSEEKVKEIAKYILGDEKCEEEIEEFINNEFIHNSEYTLFCEEENFFLKSFDKSDEKTQNKLKKFLETKNIEIW